MGDTHRVITPENIELQYNIAGIGSRFLAIAIDTLLQGLIYSGVLLIARVFVEDFSNHNITNIWDSMFAVTLLGVLFLIYVGYYLFLETIWNGQTIGKKLVHIRVRKEDGTNPSFWNILLRNIIRLIDFLPFLYAFGILVMFTNNKAKRLGDLAAGTIVVKELSGKKLAAFIDNSSPQNTRGEDLPYSNVRTRWQEAGLPSFDLLVKNMTKVDYQLLKSLEQRQQELDNFPTLAMDLLQQIIKRTSHNEVRLDLALAKIDLKETLLGLLVHYENTEV